MAVLPAYTASSATPCVVIVLAVVGALIVVPPFLAAEPGETLIEISPIFLMAAPVLLIILIKCLGSSASPSPAFTSEPVPIHPPAHRGSGSSASPVGVAIVLVIVLVLIWYQSSGVDDSEE